MCKSLIYRISFFILVSFSMTVPAFSQQLVVGEKQIIDLTANQGSADYGSIVLMSTPSNASIFIDGKNAGKTPLKANKLAPGNHEIVMELDGYDKVLSNVRIIAGKNPDINIELRKYTGQTMSMQTAPVEEEKIPFMLVESKPSFQGGDANTFSQWVNQQLVYPDIAKTNNVQGRVLLQFTICTDGYIRNIKVLRGVDPSLDAEAVRVVSMSPQWTPGKQNEKPVAVTYTFPVIFALN